ncbi:hypothetical protein KCU32_004476 [Vibrio parahaemolyticus]|nr:hypothetical protein [Vibrio parahaemolyticus]
MPINLDATQPIVYKKSFVAFLDVLGFKQMVQSRNQEKLNQYFGIVNSAIDYLKSIPSKQEIGSIVISDSIILTVPHSEDQDENLYKLRQLCIAVGLIQQNLAVKGIWLRGAISSGDTYFNAAQNQIVGPAYINAYLLEEKLAVNPRVILDSKIIPDMGFSNSVALIEALNSDNGAPLMYSNWGERILFEWSYPNGTAVKEIPQDLPLFIDYISPLIEDDESQKIKRVIGHIQKNMYLDTRVYSKYRWVADYMKSLAKRGELNDYPLSDENGFNLSNL